MPTEALIVAMISAVKYLRTKLKTDPQMFPSGQEVVLDLVQELDQVRPDWQSADTALPPHLRQRSRQQKQLYLQRAKSPKTKRIESYFYKQ